MDAVVDAFRVLLDDSMLEEIAEADYETDVAEHRAALRRLRDEQRVLAATDWHPREPLELIRWSQPEDPAWRPGATGIRGHTMRAFSCAILLRAAAEPENFGYFDGENSTLAPLVESAFMLGPSVQKAVAQFLTWRTPQLGFDEERPFFAFALLILAVLLRHGLADEDLGTAAVWVKAEEAADRRISRPRPDEDGWLLGITYYNLRFDTWRFLARRLVEEAKSIASQTVRERLVEIGAAVADPR